MEFNPEKFTGISKQLRSEESRESGRQELADLMAVLVGEDREYFGDSELREKIENAVASFPAKERRNIISELQNITKEAGWKTAHDIVAGALDLDKEIERTVGQREQIEIYRHTVRRPENIQHFKDFMNPEGGPTHYWIPRKYDIQRYVKTAVEAHTRSGKSGTIKVLDIGGGSGFLGKLVADEARNQGVELEVVVMDPDTETVTKAKEAFSDTGNLKFEIGTSNQALAMFGPELTGADKDRFDELKKKRLELLELGKEELSHIKALLVSLEGESEDETTTPDISSVLSGAFGNRARTILEQSGIALDSLPPLEQIRDTLADFYNSRWESHQKQILNIRDEQEQIYAEKGIGEAKVDMVLNSWMPIGLDFTREMRMLNAPAIIYARERGGATGVDYPSENPVNLGKESSYSTGDNYDDTSWWEGVATSGVRTGSYGYSGGVANVSQIHIRKGVGISDEELEISDPSDNEKYAWEKSLEELIGRQRIEDKHFY
ncbi:MAG: hypothetical protein A3E32_03500 [Candidatus Zambryskibacteria bacterium RIFCSPHIGHO2_12_FULL_38_37]|uniref:Methyltransferase domain-containing protein n=1 Tax=Candidatus Zambryskibacteria bacterium RIFCSPHIGHO2_12_FULL_38_37 TaxID=1802751 RepID=A0A1G2TMN3_9BACT|nr:MAG: hypothetical protein A3E32_03500 [Candidatus Zambryskibacteria bacterium RIFCSPHIGHO2_12_FULL_38_37]